jgi:hypothetical protein
MMMRDFDLVRRGGERWRAGVCLAIIAVLLYNPFFTILSSSREDSVRHALSFRATVASSELFKLKGPESNDATAIGCCDLLDAFTLLQSQRRQSARECNTEAPFFLTNFLSGNLWFRPPPAASSLFLFF